MSEQLYTIALHAIKILIQGIGYVYLLEPKWNRALTLLLFTAIGTVPASMAPLSGSFLWTLTRVAPTLLVLLVLLFRGTFTHKLGIFATVCFAELSASLILWSLAISFSGARTFTSLQNNIDSPDSLLIHVCYWLILLAVLTMIILLLRRHENAGADRRRPALLLFVSAQALAQVLLFAMSLRYADAPLYDHTISALWMLDCAGLCTLGAFLAATLYEARQASKLEAAMVLTRMEKQYALNEDGYAAEAAGIQAEVMQQLDALAERISAGTPECPAPAPPLLFADSAAVNSLLRHKMQQAAERNVQVTCHSRIEIPALSEFSMCTIVGNMMDNALSSVPAHGAWISLGCIKRGGVWSLSCRNSVGPRQSQPAGERHGLGLSIIRAAALEAGGRMYVQSGADTFAVILSFSDDNA